ncbi:MAG: ATP-grasp domain-containing protein [Bacteroidota bacterium]
MIAIHHVKNSFSEEWINYCKKNKIDYTLIDLFDNNILSNLREKKVKYLLFHISVGDYKTDLILKTICLILEKEGIRVFPSYNEYWHYDDKLKQKYLFEHTNIPHASMTVFYNKKDAINWAEWEARYPFVFKLRGGAGSQNVKLVENKNQAFNLIKIMFGKGFNQAPNILQDFGTKIRKHNKQNDWARALLRLPMTFSKRLKARKELSPEKGYFLTQEFYPDNDYDTRIAIIGDKAMGFVRKTRSNDFRASGSGLIDYDRTKIDISMIKMAFDAAEKIGGHSLAFDFIYDREKSPKIIEVSYCYVASFLFHSGGYWDRSLNFNSEPQKPEHLIIESLLNTNSLR